MKGLGIRGMYQGTLATLSRDIPFSLIFFPLYANLKKVFADQKGENRRASSRLDVLGRDLNANFSYLMMLAYVCVYSIVSLLGAGCLAGAMGAWAATPPDVIKTR